MSANISGAVMAQRHEPPDSLDFFPTPPWATRALCEWLARTGEDLEHASAIDPCCGKGHMVLPLSETFQSVVFSDVFPYDTNAPLEDYLIPGYMPGEDWHIFNPPFLLAAQFIQKALGLAGTGVAAFVRTAFLESRTRFEELYAERPPTEVLIFVERPILHKGVCRDPDKAYFDPKAVDRRTGQKGLWKRPSTATSYAWLVWRKRLMKRNEVPRLYWIPPGTRTRLTRPGDYDEATEGEAKYAEGM